MTERTRIAAAAVIGAAIGGFAGYVFFTNRGRAFWRQMEPALEDMLHELHQFRGTVTKASTVASEGWRLVSDALREGLGHDARYERGSGQTQPF